ncbi:MAG: WD domain protein [Chaenotheca gracillima]|nr:MAG: WD domain protein [Chaenotheca gracillima]
MPSHSESPSRSGILTDPTGVRHIPSSVRPDGTTRKQIKIRPGYKPPEDVEVYKNRTAEAWKTRGAGGVPGAANIEDDGPGSASSNKNAKRREARKKAKAKLEDDSEPERGRADEVSGSGKSNGSTSQLEMNMREMESHNTQAAAPSEAPAPFGLGTAASGNIDPADPELEKEKQAKRLQKKLRQAKDLMDKKDKGENLLPEQFEKVIKIQELTRQLSNLGFDTNGDRKDA